MRLLGSNCEGSSFIFGDLSRSDKFGVIFAVYVLPIVIFFAALMGVLYHLGVMKAIVKELVWMIARVMRVSGDLSTI